MLIKVAFKACCLPKNRYIDHGFSSYMNEYNFSVLATHVFNVSTKK